MLMQLRRGTRNLKVGNVETNAHRKLVRQHDSHGVPVTVVSRICALQTPRSSVMSDVKEGRARLRAVQERPAVEPRVDPREAAMQAIRTSRYGVIA